MKKEMMIYQSKSGKIEFRGDLKQDTVWGTQQQIAQLFGVQKPAISKHLHNIYNTKELDKKSTVSILETVQKEGKRAFAFVWFLKQALRLSTNMTPPALTALTLLVAESHPKDKDKIIGLILMLLQKKKVRQHYD